MSLQDKENRYVNLCSKIMVGCFLIIFVKHKLLGRISDLALSKIKTGVWGSSGNKGAVIARLNINDTSIMFMNCHLMSGKNKGK
jgi:hypothetical protein